MSKQGTPAVGSLINKLMDIRESMKPLNAQIARLKEEKEETELKLIEMMDALGTDQTRNDVATASISDTVVPQVEDWDRFYRWIHRNKAYYMLERRPASVAFRETLEQRKNKPIPGVQSYTRRTINLRTRNTK